MKRREEGLRFRFALHITNVIMLYDVSNLQQTHYLFLTLNFPDPTKPVTERGGRGAKPPKFEYYPLHNKILDLPLHNKIREPRCIVPAAAMVVAPWALLTMRRRTCSLKFKYNIVQI